MKTINNLTWSKTSILLTFLVGDECAVEKRLAYTPRMLSVYYLLSTTWQVCTSTFRNRLDANSVLLIHRYKQEEARGTRINLCLDGSWEKD